MKWADSFRVRLQQINAQAFAAPLPHLADEMAKTTRQLQKEYGDIRQAAKTRKASNPPCATTCTQVS